MRFLMRHMRIKRRFPFPSYTSLESSVHPDKTGLHQSIPKRGNMIQKLIRLPEVINRTGYQRSNIYLLMSQGQFPKSVSIGGRAVAWLESEVVPLMPLVLMILWMDLSFVCSYSVILKPTTVLR